MARLDINPGYRAEIRKEPEYRVGLEECTKPAAEAARLIAPVRTGAYRESIKATTANGRVYLTATDYKAWWIEMGTAGVSPTPVFATLRRGARIAGLKFQPRK